MTALAIAQEIARRIGIPVPSSIFGASNVSAAQLGALLNAVMEDLSERWDWGEVTRQATFPKIDGTDQGAVTELFDAGYKSLVTDSGWNRTRNIRLYGPINAVGWAQLQSLPVRGISENFRVVGGRLHIDSPQAQIGDIIAFEYLSTYTVIKSSGGGFDQIYTADGDISLLPNAVIKAGLHWQWKYTKGLSYAEEKRTYELMAGTAAARGGSAGIKYLDQTPYDLSEQPRVGAVLLN